MKCPNCHHEQEESQGRCSRCGFDLSIRSNFTEGDSDPSQRGGLSEDLPTLNSGEMDAEADPSVRPTMPSDSFDDAADSVPLGSVDSAEQSADETFVSNELGEFQDKNVERTIASLDEDDSDPQQTVRLDESDDIDGPPTDPGATIAAEEPGGDQTFADQTLVSEELSDVDVGDDPQGTIAIDPSLLQEDAVSDRTVVIEESDLSNSGEQPPTLGFGPDDAGDRTLVSEDFDDGGATVHLPNANDDGDRLLDANLKTIQTQWGNVDADDNPRMTIKSRGERSILKSGLLGDSLGHVPTRSLKTSEEKEDSSLAEYELLRILGEGGMGIVWSAKQTSVDRMVAVKMIKGAQAQKRSQRQKFLAEAIVTGDLDHPNIVPIYDVGTDRTGSLFYSMKQVKGIPWLKVLRKKSLQENLQILLQVGDAIAFAHSRGIIHRDLKPENVMLGEYGEVLVMDWGLALVQGDFEKARELRKTTSMGGTPAYMAPEMATGPIDRISFASDIYLLGAILWEIVTGRPPHPGKRVQECLLAAIRNEITPTEQTGELVQIAMKTMASNPRDRYATVQDFQHAVREYLSHSESLILADRAHRDLQRANETGDYRDYSKAVFGFEEAYELWSGNTEARAGLIAANREYAASALSKGDYDLGISLLSESEPEHQEMLKHLRVATEERDARQRRLQTAKRVMAAMAASIFIVVSIALVWIRAERDKAIEAQEQEVIAREKEQKQRIIAEEATEEAVSAKEKALAAQAEEKRQREQAELARKEAVAAQIQEEQQRRQAELAKEAAIVAQMNEAKQKEAALLAKEQEAKQRMAAEQAREEAEAATKAAILAKRQEEEAKDRALAAQQQEAQARKEAELAKEREEYEAYIARIGLAAAKIEENAFDVASNLLQECDLQLRNWEWGRLKHLCDQASQVIETRGPVDSVAISPDGQFFATGSWDHLARIWDLATRELIREIPYGGLYVHSVAWSPDQSMLALSGNDPDARILLVDPDSGNAITKWNGHDDAVVRVRFSANGRYLVSCSYDQTAKLWDLSEPSSPRQVALLDGHSWWVWDAAFSPEFDPESPERVSEIVTVSQDGRAIVWSLVQTVRDDVEKTTPVGLFADSQEIPFVQRAVFTAHEGPVYSAAFVPNQRAVATAGYDKRILIWNPDEIPALRVEDLLQSEDANLKYRELTGHTAPVQSIRISKEGSLLVSGGRDNAVIAWSLETGKPIQSFRGHFAAIRSVDIAPDGRRIVSAGQDERAIIWSADNYEEIRVLQGRQLTGHADSILGVRFSPSGDRVLTASRDRTARTWDVQTGKLLATLAEGHDYLTSRAEFFADGKYMVTAAADNTVRLWNVATGTQFLRLDRTGRSAALAISADERWLATGSEEDDLKLWDLTQLLEFAEGNKDRSEESRQPQPRFIKVHNGRVTAIAFAPKENRCLSCDTLGRCVLTDVETGTAVWSVRHHTRRVTACAFTPDGSQILTASNDHTVSRINSTNGQELSHLVLSHDSPVSSMALSQDGQQVVTVASPPDQESHRGAILRRWNAQTADLLATVQVEGFGLNDIQSVPNSQLAIAVATDNTVRLFSLQSDSSSEGTVWLDFDRLGGLVWSARFTKDGQSVLTVGGTEAQLWDAGTRQEKMNFSPHGTVAAADFSPDGKWIVTGSWDNSAKIWDAESGTAVRKIEGGHDGYINSVRFSPNGEQILTASDDGTAKLWHVADGKLIQSFQGHLGRVRQAVFSHNGKRILTVSSDRTARLWDREAGTMIGEPFVGHKWSLLCGAFSPDDSQILTGSEDNSAILWDLSSKKKVAEFQGHTAAVTSVAFSRDGERAFTASQDISAKLWDVTPGHEGTEILTLAGHSQELTSIDISPKDGRHLLTGSRDGTAILWLTSEWNDKAE